MRTSTYNNMPWNKLLLAGCLIAIISVCFSFSKGIDEAIGLKISQKEGNILVNIKSHTSSSRSQFYIFNMESELVKQYDISGSKLIVISSLKKGIYLYEFFSNDAHLKNGKIELK